MLDTNLFLNIEIEQVSVKDIIPDILPVSIIDIERLPPAVNMNLHMSDPCPTCGAFNMMTGDFICYGQCGICEEKDYQQMYAAMYPADNER